MAPPDSPSEAFASLLSSTRREIDARLDALLADELTRAARHGHDTRALLASVRDLTLRGGKRARPAMAAVGHLAAGGRPDHDAVHEVGVALELLQTYLLIHDDWMDGDLTRRGGPSVHALLRGHFGDPQRGDAAAILAGDLASALAQQAIGRAAASLPHGGPLLAFFAEIQRDVVYGQLLDLAGRAEDIETVHHLKTGSYTVRGPLLLGALVAGASADTIAVLDAYAAPLGVAFQLCDDLLSAFGDEATTGKPRGNDLRAGKPTAVIHEAQGRLDEPQKQAIAAVFGKPDAPPALVERAIEALDRCGARAAVEARRDNLLEQSLGALRCPPLDERGVGLLQGAARALAIRST